MKRGDVYWADLDPRSGHEEQGLRPVIIISHDAYNKVTQWGTLIVIPITSSENQAKRGPGVVKFKKPYGVIHKQSIALCFQITTIDKDKIKEKIGSLSKEELIEIEESICHSIGIELAYDDEPSEEL